MVMYLDSIVGRGSGGAEPAAVSGGSFLSWLREAAWHRVTPTSRQPCGANPSSAAICLLHSLAFALGLLVCDMRMAIGSPCVAVETEWTEMQSVRLEVTSRLGAEGGAGCVT